MRDGSPCDRRGVFASSGHSRLDLGSTERCGVDSLTGVWSLKHAHPLVVFLAHRAVGRMTATGRCPCPNPQHL